MKKIKLLLILFIFSSYNFSFSNIKIVLEGAARSGKSSLLNFFKEKGFKTIPEVATKIINDALENGDEHPVKKDPTQFQVDIINTQIKLEKELEDQDENEIAFLDRTLFSALGYSDYRGLKLPRKINQKAIKHIKNADYTMIFFPEPLPYKKDMVRVESSSEEIKETWTALWNKCVELGFEPIKIPRFTEETKEEEIHSRAMFIINKIYEKLGIKIFI